jgi:2-oxoglutarate dehydrogenase E2 component (dihydrolipoamide succinyltransferase)
MKKNVVAPTVGESISEVSILKWNKEHGSSVKNGETILEIESDKATVEVIAEQDGVLQILKQAGERVPVGDIIGFVDDSIAPTAGVAPVSAGGPPPLPGSAPKMPPIPGSAPSAPAMAPPPPLPTPLPSSAPSSNPPAPPSGLSPAVRRASVQHGVDTTQIAGTGKEGRVTKGDVMAVAASPAPQAPQAQAPQAAPAAPKAPTQVDRPGDRRVPMTMLRQKIAERLVHAQHTAAILTTFNEVDMSAVMKLRSANKDAFKAKHGVNLSFMSFFARASVAALKAIPEVNATIDGKDMIYHDYIDLGIAVGTERGLVVPVLRNAEKMSFVDIEKKIGEYAVKGRDGKLSMADLTGGTFTISNGGTYGSLMSTPILNPPQSGILGMHKIMDRPVAINGNVEIRPMMYIALSYDHRLIDGKGAVTWLVHLKDLLENPEKLEFTL